MIYINKLYVLLKLYPKLSYHLISNNPNINLAIIEEFEDHIDWEILSQNKYLTIDILRKYINKPWNWYYLSENEFITIEILRELRTDLWQWEEISRNKSLTMNIVREFRYKPWNLDSLVNNRKLNASIISMYNFSGSQINYICKYLYIDMDILINNNGWLWYSLSSNPWLTISIVEKYENWDWKRLSESLTISLDTFRKYSHKWSYYYLIRNPNLDLNILKELRGIDWGILTNTFKSNPNIVNYPEYNWDCNVLSYTFINIWKLVEINPDNWNWEVLSRNPYITIHIINKFINKPWDWIELSRNSNITIKNILNNPGLWNKEYIYENPNITLKYILNNTNLNLERLARNLFNKDPYVEKNLKIRIWFNKWYSIRTKKYWKARFSANIDILNLRLRDNLTIK